MIYEANEEFIKELISKGKNFSIVPDEFNEKGVITTIKYTSFETNNTESIQVQFYCDVYIIDDEGETYYLDEEDGKLKFESDDKPYAGAHINSDLTWINLFDLTKVLNNQQQADLYDHTDKIITEKLFDLKEN